MIILITLKEIKDVITEESLDNYYLMREEELSILTPEERKRRSERIKEYKVNYNDILNAIDNIPPCFEETKENIIKTILRYPMSKIFPSTFISLLSLPNIPLITFLLCN